VHITGLDLSGEIDLLLRGEELGAAGLPHPHLQLLGVVGYRFFFIKLIFLGRVEFEKIVFRGLCRWIVQNRCATRLHVSVTTGGADRDCTSPSRLSN
jgi:hypothetical protein